MGLLLIAGCHRTSSLEVPAGAGRQASPFQAPGSDPWKLVWTDPKTPTSALLWNGLIGIRVDRAGDAMTDKGEPGSMFLIDNYQKGGEEKIQPVPNPMTMAQAVNGKVIDPTAGHDYKQELDLRTGLLTTSWTQDLGASEPTSVVRKTLITPDAPTIAQEWSLGPLPKGTLSFQSDFTGKEWSFRAYASDGGFHLGDRHSGHWVFKHRGVQPEDGGVAINSDQDIVSPVESTFTIAKDGDSALFDSLITVRRLDAKAARDPVQKNPHDFEDGPTPFEQAEKAAAAAWDSRWKTDIDIDGPVEDQQAVRSFLFYLTSAIHPAGKMSISPMGLSSDLYGGHVFWDADIWVMPALVFVDPSAASDLAGYRLRLKQAAQNNYEAWFRDRTSSHAIVDPPGGPLGGNLKGIKYPWESSVSGTETAPGPSRLEDHVTGTVAFSLGMAADLALVNAQQAQNICGSAGAFYYDRSDPTQGDREIKDVMSPDENHIGDNDLYTNLVAQWCLNGGTWNLDVTRKPPQMVLPKDQTSFLTYDKDPVKSYKQAAAVLAIYPLQYPPAEAQAKVMMDRFADKVIKNGPAMTDSVHAIIWARLGETDKAYDTWRKGWMEFVRPPFLLFSEKRGQDRTYFTTGAAGELQSVIYGFLGFRIDSQKQAGGAWSLKLKGDRWLSIKPNLPKAWNRVTFRNFHVLGKSYTLTATHQSVQVTQGE